jgi:hypothetical protein
MSRDQRKSWKETGWKRPVGTLSQEGPHFWLRELPARPSGTFRGIKRKRKPMGYGEFCLVPWAPSQQLISRGQATSSVLVVQKWVEVLRQKSKVPGPPGLAGRPRDGGGCGVFNWGFTRWGLAAGMRPKPLAPVSCELVLLLLVQTRPCFDR